LARKLTQQEARQMAARRKRFRGGRPLKPRPYPLCDAPCTSTTQAAAHCVGRNAPATVRPVAVPPQGSQAVNPQQEYPKWKYHPTKEAVVVSDAQAEAALGEGWGDKPI
jgi:hypothetical protein